MPEGGSVLWNKIAQNTSNQIEVGNHEKTIALKVVIVICVFATVTISLTACATKTFKIESILLK